eukprot:6644419-Pyramimonas_sp.AAC.1
MDTGGADRDDDDDDDSPDDSALPDPAVLGYDYLRTMAAAGKHQTPNTKRRRAYTRSEGRSQRGGGHIFAVRANRSGEGYLFI